MPRFAASEKQVTDQQVLKQLALLRIDSQGVEFSQDYAHRGLGKGHSPYAKFYRNLNGHENFMVVSGLPMVDGSGDRLTPGWQFQAPYFVAKKNLYTARIQGSDVELVVGNDDAFGRRQGASLGYSPRLFVNSVERFPTGPVLLPVDPWNPNYTENVLEWDYGVCKRRLRTVEGRVHGYWIFPTNPGGDVLIRYNQVGGYRLKLGPYQQNADEEFIPASVFASATYPLEVSDTSTFNPDANPETTSVDGWCRHLDASEISWATLIAGTGTDTSDLTTGNAVPTISAGLTTDEWKDLSRAIHLFDTSGLDNLAVISAVVMSVYGYGKANTLNASPTFNIYSSAPQGNTSLALGDFDSLGATAYAGAIAYADWSTTGYNDFTFNATGRAAVSLTAVSKFGLREATYDVGAVSPTWVSDTNCYVQQYWSEQGAGYKPKLVVTWALPKGGAASMGAKLMSVGAL